MLDPCLSCQEYDLLNKVTVALMYYIMGVKIKNISGNN
jgi:hypothetical protein